MKTQPKKIDLSNIIKQISGHATIGRLDEAGNFMQKKVPPADDQAPAEEPAPDAQPAQKAPPSVAKAPKDAAPASTEQPTPPVEEPSAPEAPEPDVQPEESPDVADSEVDQAEQEIDQPSFVKVNSDSGVKFLLTTILTPAIETNTLDSIAQDFIEKLKINTPEDFQKFKGETIQFRGVAGFNQLISSMENFIA